MKKDELGDLLLFYSAKQEKMVTLDEYIEIAKYYSGPGSSVFINGVLDKLVTALTDEGEIRKTGRGLI